MEDLAYPGDDLKPALEPGNIRFLVGSSSRDIRLRYDTEGDGMTAAGETYEGGFVQPAPADISKAQFPPGSLSFSDVMVHRDGAVYYTDPRDVHGEKDGLLYLRTPLTMRTSGAGRLLFSSDGPVRVWVNGTASRLHSRCHYSAEYSKIPVRSEGTMAGGLIMKLFLPLTQIRVRHGVWHAAVW